MKSASAPSLFTVIILCLGIMLKPDYINAQAPTKVLTKYNHHRIELNTKGMYLLSGWALKNIAVGVAGYFNSQGRLRHMYQMNVGWNIINMAIAGGALYIIASRMPLHLIFPKALPKQSPSKTFCY